MWPLAGCKIHADSIRNGDSIAGLAITGIIRSGLARRFGTLENFTSATLRESFDETSRVLLPAFLFSSAPLSRRWLIHFPSATKGIEYELPVLSRGGASSRDPAWTPIGTTYLSRVSNSCFFCSPLFLSSLFACSFTFLRRDTGQTIRYRARVAGFIYGVVSCTSKPINLADGSDTLLVLRANI